MTEPFRDRVKELRHVQAGTLKVNPANWRTHPDAQRSALMEGLERIGWVDALVAREDEYGALTLIDGHLRAELDPRADVPVLIVDVTEEEADLLLAVLDPIKEMAKRDRMVLTVLLGEVGSDPLVAEVHRLRELRDSGVGDPDELPTLARKRARKGQVWVLGRHIIVCGDSGSEKLRAKVTLEKEPTMMVTDPPYGTGLGDDPAKRAIVGDEKDGDQQKLVRRALEVWRPTGDVYMFAPSHISELQAFADGWEQAGVTLRQLLVWVKDTYPLSRMNYHWQQEHIMYGWVDRDTHPPRKGGTSYRGKRTETSVWEASRPKASEMHPTMKPVALVERAIENSSRRGNVVVDPFLGSGTTLIAAERLHRLCVGIEVEPRYVDVALTRWEDFTGQEAQKV